jgi:hypothetical protein
MINFTPAEPSVAPHHQHRRAFRKYEQKTDANYPSSACAPNRPSIS